MNLHKRLQALEQQLSGEPPATLTMPDGRIEILRGPGDYMRELL